LAIRLTPNTRYAGLSRQIPESRLNRRDGSFAKLTTALPIRKLYIRI